MTPEAVARAFRWACEIELRALKPGNVHVHAPSRDLTVAQFRHSARAAAPAIASRQLRVGARVLAATEATQRVVGTNTNLGILLLAAPLCHAALIARGKPLREAVQASLSALDIEDARLAFRAITLAQPAGLGIRRAEDVRGAPSTTLLEAMRLAARRDRVARQYATCYADVFKIGVPTLARARADGVAVAEAASRLHMAFLRRFSDSHLTRKFGASVAASVRREANVVPDTRAGMLRFDRSLKRRGFNPGTSADLVVASLLAWRLGALLGRDRPEIEPAVVKRRRHQRPGDSKPAKRR